MKKIFYKILFYSILNKYKKSCIPEGQQAQLSIFSISSLKIGIMEKKFYFLFFLLGWILSSSSVSLQAQCSSPTFVNCINRSVTLSSTECSTPLVPPLQAVSNCPVSSNFSITQNSNPSNIISGLGCMLGKTHIYQIFGAGTNGVYTDITINSVEVGIFQSTNSPLIEVKIYLTGGSLNPSNWTEVGSGSAVIPNVSNVLYSIPVSASTIDATEDFAVEVIAPNSAFYSDVLGLNMDGVQPTYYRQPACGVHSLTQLISQHVPIIVYGTRSSIAIRPFGSNTYPADYDFAPGYYTLNYEAVDAVGNTAICSFNFEVLAYSAPSNALACNDLVQISLDIECAAVIGPDQILEGDFYGCYDDYQVVVYNKQNQPIGNVITGQYIGDQLRVEVRGPNGNKCWGEILIEDKYPPVLECLDVYATCTTDLRPGSPISSRVTFRGSPISGADISDAGPWSRDFPFNVFGLNGATVTDLNVVVDIDHSNFAELAISVTAPDGTFALLTGTGISASCADNRMLVTFDDQSANSYTDLLNFCALNPGESLIGNYQPSSSLSVYNGKDPSGLWTISVVDISSGNGGRVNSVALVFGQSGAKVSFPTNNFVTFSSIGDNLYRVVGIDNCGPAQMSYTDEVFEESCASIYSKVIKRTWQAIDIYGHASQSCDQFIYVYRNGLEDLIFPPNYDDIDKPALSCRLFGNTVPTPDDTGRPGGDICESVQVLPYEDTRIDICPGTYKILRKWRLLEWCTGRVIDHIQIIKVKDDEGPVIICPPEMTIYTDDFECAADWLAPKPTVTFDCSPTTYTIGYKLADAQGNPPEDEALYQTDNVLGNATTGYTIKSLPLGRSWIRYEVVDQCGNKTACFTEIDVEDNVPPVAVCLEFSTVSIGGDGTAKVYAGSFDNGSWDNCGDVELLARKMTNKCPLGTTTEFREYVEFCCDEVGSNIMVELKVTDRFGNMNTCMVEIRVVDKLPPYIVTCAPDITLDCWEDHLDLDLTGRPEYIDNCPGATDTFTDLGGVDNCGVGLITRRWVVTDKVGLTAQCTQRITFSNSKPFRYGDIIWPEHFETNQCFANLDPENLPILYSRPRFIDKKCSLVSATYSDQIFTFVEGACLKILRTWTVIDWCTYNEANGTGKWTYLQTLAVKNKKAPEFNNCADVTLSSFGQCRGDIDFTISATDDCTPEIQLKYSYTIDLNNDGSIDITGTGPRINRILPDGRHKVIWTVTDNCLNKNTCSHILTVRDDKKPTPYCISIVTSVVMPSSGMLTIWPTDFDYGSFDNCTPQNQLRFSFSSNVNDKSKTFTCADIPDGQEMYIPIEMWVTDLAGNQDYCSVAIILQDNTGDVCPDQTGNLAFVSGRITTEDNRSVQGATVSIYKGDNMYKQTTSQNAGNYVIANIFMGDNYKVEAVRNGIFLNGVSTLDLVMIQRHILNLESFNSAYKTIAADVNNDSKVTAADLIAIRKAILGELQSFPNGQKSWRFVDAAQTFADVRNPFPYHDKIKIETLNSNIQNANFVAVKIGDVNGTASMGLTEGYESEVRSSEAVVFEVDNLELEAGESAQIPVLMRNIEEILGFQFSLLFDRDQYIIESLEGGSISIENSNYSEAMSNSGIINVSWNGENAVKINTDKPVFYISVRALTKTRPAESLALSSTVTAAEIYDGNFNVLPLKLELRNADHQVGGFTLYQNQPNPFKDATLIPVYVPQNGQVKLSIFDVTGRKLKEVSAQVSAGIYHFNVTKDDLGANGIMYYEVEYNDIRAVKKMILIE